jgi:hypothetical protein
MPKRPRTTIPVLLLLTACLLAVAHGLAHWPGAIDDAYISFRYAANLAAGEGLVFNPGERVEGYSNLLWTLGAAVAIRAGIEPMLAAKLAGLLSLLLTLVILHRLLGRTVDGLPARAAGLLLFALSVPSAYWSVQGMETPFFTLLLTAAFWRLGEELDPDRPAGFPWSALLLAAACLTRPEGPIYLAAVLGARVSAGRRPWRRDLAWLALFLGPLALHLAWRRAYYGEWLPNTYFAKGSAGAGFSPAAHADGLAYIGAFLGAAWWIPALLALLGVVALVLAFIPGGGGTPARRGRLLTPLLWLAGACFFAWQANGDWMPHDRFLVPALPALALLAAAGIGLVAGLALRLAGRPAGVAAGVILALLLATGLAVDAGQESGLPTASRLSEPEQPRLLPMAMALMETLRDGETVVYGDIGVVGYLNPGLRIIDNRGLTDHTVARLIYSRPHRMGETVELQRQFLSEFGQKRPEAVVLIINRKSGVPTWQTEIIALHPRFQRSYAEVRRLKHRRVNHESLCLRRDLLQRTVEPARVIARYREAIRLAPRVVRLRLRLAEICRSTGRHDLARETLEAAVLRFPDNRGVQQMLKQGAGS